tara:strand:- start:108 stop:308 length:201 start_codon:yes stop_codon:yes gene_type:complete
LKAVIFGGLNSDLGLNLSTFSPTKEPLSFESVSFSLSFMFINPLFILGNPFEVYELYAAGSILFNL